MFVLLPIELLFFDSLVNILFHPSKPIYLPLYPHVVQFSSAQPNAIPGVVHERHRSLHHMMSAVGAAAVADCISNPLWVVRTRMMTDIYHGDRVGKLHTWAAVLHVFRNEGIRGLYKGLGASFLGLSHVAIQFPLYEELKRMARERDGSGTLSSVDLIFASAGSKLVASSITYPHEVIRARLQDCRGQTGFGVFEIISAIWKTEGVKGFYQGLVVNLARVLPACISTFVSYEFIKSALS